MRVALGTDHAGFALKERIKQTLIEAGHDVEDFGCHDEAVCDYPDFVRPAAQAVSSGERERAVVLGGSGNGEAMVANRLPGVRCALCWNVETARLAREHNDANVISLGARMVDEVTALEMIRVWLETPFTAGRHARRIAKIDRP